MFKKVIGIIIVSNLLIMAFGNPGSNEEEDKESNIGNSILQLDNLSSRFAGGNGSVSNPYQISNVTHLQNMEENLSANYILINDIDASLTKIWNWNGNYCNGFDPIGWRVDHFNFASFTGSLDGQGFTISGLYIHRPQGYWVGLFTDIRNGGEVRNLIMSDLDITGYWVVGGISGGLDRGVVHNCSISGKVYGHFYAGALLGAMDYGSVSRCTSEGQINGDGMVGGLLGMATCGSIRNSSSSCSVGKGNDRQQVYWGGLVGVSYADIHNSYATGDVSGNWEVGGLVGRQSNSGRIFNCYSTGKVIGNEKTGGLIGHLLHSTVTNSFWDIDSSGLNYSSGGTGKSTAEMKLESTYTDAGWDFIEVWGINENVTYPYHDGSFENQDPVANDNEYATDEDGVFEIYPSGLMSNDYDPDPEDHSLFLYIDPQSRYGATVKIWNKYHYIFALLYDPNGSPTIQALKDGEYLLDTFRYGICDRNGGMDWATITINITGHNDDPIALDDHYSISQGGYNHYFDVLANDSDIEGYPISIISVTDPANGSAIIINSSTSIQYTPEPEAFGEDLFTYMISDGNGGLATASVIIWIQRNNSSPVLTYSELPTAWIREFYSQRILCIDPDDDILTWSLSTNATWLSLDQNGFINGTPYPEDLGWSWVNVSVDDGFGGFDTISLTIRVDEKKYSPVIITEDIDRAVVDVFYNVDYNATDVDTHKALLSWTIESNTSFLSMEPKWGLLTGLPSIEDIGTYWVNVSVSDDENHLTFTNFTLEVININDAPIGFNHLLEFEEDCKMQLIEVQKIFNDKDNDTLHISYFGQKNLRINVTAFSIGLTPMENWNGWENITMTASDGEFNAAAILSIHILPCNDPPTSVLIKGVLNNERIMNGTPLNLSANVHDVDLEYEGDSFTYLWTSNISGTLGKERDLANLTLLSGNHEITVKVTDKEGGSIQASIIVNVEDEPEEKEDDDDQETPRYLLLGIIIIIIILLLLIGGVVLLLFIRSKSTEDEEDFLEPEEDIDTIYEAEE